MAEENLKAVRAKSFKLKTTDSKGTETVPDLLAKITAEKWALGKIIMATLLTSRPGGGKFCYLAVWQDKITRRIIGWSLSFQIIRISHFSPGKSHW